MKQKSKVVEIVLQITKLLNELKNEHRMATKSVKTTDSVKKPKKKKKSVKKM